MVGITISDVAECAGVSKSTVSLVLNERPGVSQKTREAVLRAATELGYTLRHPSNESPPPTRTLLVICQRYPGRRLDDLGRVYSSYITGIKQASSTRAWDLVVLPVSAESVDHSQSPKEVMLDTAQADAILILGLRSPNDPLLPLVKQLNVPFVALGRHWDGADFSCVGVDDQQALVAVVEHLVTLGHHNISFLGEELTRTFMWHHLRLKGFREGLQQHRLSHLSDHVIFADSPETGVTQILMQWPDTSAIIAVHDHWAEGVARALEERGLNIPDDISVVGYDNINGIETTQEGNFHQLTSIDPRQRDAGRVGTELLLRYVGEAPIHHMQITLQWRLVKRASTGSISPAKG